MDTYRATNTLNGKFYIGSAQDFERRKSQHLKSKENYPFQTDLRKSPEAFVWEVYIDDLDTNEHEVRLLREFFFDPRCYNINPLGNRPPDATGKTKWKNELLQKQKLCLKKPEGEGWEKGVLQKTRDKTSGKNHHQYGTPRTDDFKQTVSKKMSGKRNHNYGIPRTNAQKQEQSERMSGENNPSYGRTGALHHSSKVVIAIKPDGTELHFGSGHEAGRELGIAQSNLTNYLKLDRPMKSGKFKDWQFLSENR